MSFDKIFDLTAGGYLYFYNILMQISFFFPSHTSTFQLLDKPRSQVSSLLPPRFLPSIFIAHRVQQFHWSSIFHRVLLTHALALSASQFVHKKKSPRMYTSMHSGGFELTRLTYTRLEDNLIATGAISILDADAGMYRSRLSVRSPSIYSLRLVRLALGL